MKALFILSVVQTGLLILLFSRTIALEEEPAVRSASASGPTANTPFHSQNADNSLRQGYSSIDEGQLRRIIREELIEYGLNTPNTNRQVSQPPSHDFATASEKQYQLEQVSQRIEYFSSIGSISDMEMGNLQTEIAKLDGAGRTAMLRKLTQAMNSGAIDGRF
jgi:hypothetical protein